MKISSMFGWNVCMCCFAHSHTHTRICIRIQVVHLFGEMFVTQISHETEILLRHSVKMVCVQIRPSRHLSTNQISSIVRAFLRHYVEWNLRRRKHTLKFVWIVLGVNSKLKTIIDLMFGSRVAIRCCVSGMPERLIKFGWSKNFGETYSLCTRACYKMCTL